MWRGASRPRTTVGWLESITMRCATKSAGRSWTASRTASTSHGSACGRIATPLRPDIPRLGGRQDCAPRAAVAAAGLDDELIEDVERTLEHLGPAEVEGLH